MAGVGQEPLQLGVAHRRRYEQRLQQVIAGKCREPPRAGQFLCRRRRLAIVRLYQGVADSFALLDEQRREVAEIVRPGPSLDDGALDQGAQPVHLGNGPLLLQAERKDRLQIVILGDRNAACENAECLVGLALRLQGTGEVAVGERRFRTLRQRTAKMDFRLAPFALRRERAGEIGVSVGVVRLQRDCASVVRDRVIHAAGSRQHQRHVVVELRIALLQGDRPADQFERGVVAFALMGKNAEAVEAVDVIGVERETVAIEALGLRETSRAMMPDREVEQMIGTRVRSTAHRWSAAAGPPVLSTYGVIPGCASVVCRVPSPTAVCWSRRARQADWPRRAG